MGEVVAANGKGVAITAKHEDMQVGSAEADAGGKRQCAAVDVMHAVGLHEVGEPAAAANASNGGDLFVVQTAVLDELEVQGQYGEVATTGAPRGVVGGKIFFLQGFAGDFSSGTHDKNQSVSLDTNEFVAFHPVLYPKKTYWGVGSINQLINIDIIYDL